jgi:hypothetical protein
MDRRARRSPPTDGWKQWLKRLTDSLCSANSTLSIILRSTARPSCRIDRHRRTWMARLGPPTRENPADRRNSSGSGAAADETQAQSVAAWIAHITNPTIYTTLWPTVRRTVRESPGAVAYDRPRQLEFRRRRRSDGSSGEDRIRRSLERISSTPTSAISRHSIDRPSTVAGSPDADCFDRLRASVHRRARLALLSQFHHHRFGR